ncbi:SflA family class IV lanthipeptide [Kitasatospora sp. LaBMicrA B282]|uniref:SflA family class IV lanthipeptide n=1 Tax=Kitasatospora sp. LaBMicrA B282 TaxID=3420949 RepID=UPI003D0AC618
MSTSTLDIRDAGPLDVEDDALTFENEIDALPDSGDMLCSNGTHFTYNFTHIMCTHNS